MTTDDEQHEARYAPGIARVYANDRVEVTWERPYCFHYAACVRGSIAAFDPNRRPWIDPDAEAPERIVEIVRQCPSGALHARLLDGSASSDIVVDVPEHQPRRNGPIFVRGPIRIVDNLGNVIRQDTRVALCRCGGSSNKPFCDGTHRTSGFQA